MISVQTCVYRTIFCYFGFPFEDGCYCLNNPNRLFISHGLPPRPASYSGRPGRNTPEAGNDDVSADRESVRSVLLPKDLQLRDQKSVQAARPARSVFVVVVFFFLFKILILSMGCSVTLLVRVWLFKDKSFILWNTILPFVLLE